MKLLVGIACSLLCFSSLAAGPYDGVYQYGTNPAYYSVHQSGDTLVVASLGTMPLNNVPISVGAFVVRPATLDYWAYSIGAISGNRARVTGISAMGACSVTSDVVFDGAGTAWATFLGVVNTTFGTQQGVNCAALYQQIISTVGTTLTLRQIF